MSADFDFELRSVEEAQSKFRQEATSRRRAAEQFIVMRSKTARVWKHPDDRRTRNGRPLTGALRMKALAWNEILGFRQVGDPLSFTERFVLLFLVETVAGIPDRTIEKTIRGLAAEIGTDKDTFNRAVLGLARRGLLTASRGRIIVFPHGLEVGPE